MDSLLIDGIFSVAAAFALSGLFVAAGLLLPMGNN